MDELRLARNFDLKVGPAVSKQYSVVWKRSTLNVAELVTKRYIEGWSVDDLCVHFGVGLETLKSAYLTAKKREFAHPSISRELRNKLLKASRKFDYRRTK